MKAGNAFIAVHSNTNIGNFGKLLNGKIVTDRSRPVPDEMVDILESGSLINEVLEQIPDSVLNKSRGM